MDYHKLEQSLIDVVKEEQAKLGYRKEEIRLYYPLSSLNHFFGTEADVEEMAQMLTGLHEHMAENEFIRELVELVRRHGCTMEEIQKLFAAQGKEIHTEPIDNGEFDLLIRFENDVEDPYYYCFKDEGCHIIYHRFLPEDYADFGF